MRVIRLARIVVVLGFVLLLAKFLVAQTKPGDKPVKAVRLGKLWDGKGKVWTNAIVIVEAGKVRAVTNDVGAIPAGTEVIDLSAYTGLSGMIDVHTHLTYYTDEKAGEPLR